MRRLEHRQHQGITVIGQAKSSTWTWSRVPTGASNPRISEKMLFEYRLRTLRVNLTTRLGIIAIGQARSST